MESIVDKSTKRCRCKHRETDGRHLQETWLKQNLDHLAVLVERPPTTTEEVAPSNECICDKSGHESSVNNGVTIPARKRRIQRCGARIIRDLRHRLHDRDRQHGGSLTDTRTEKESAIGQSALKPGLLTADRDVYEETLCVWPILMTSGSVSRPTALGSMRLSIILWQCKMYWKANMSKRR